jgi:short-subunit dehydrogenase
MESLRGKNVLIVGATGDIGMHTARLLQGSGASLFLSGRDSVALQSFAQSIGVPAAQYFAADLQESPAVAELAQRYFSAFPTIDILINASGIGVIKPIETLSEEEMMQTLQINLLAPFRLLKGFLPAMKTAKKGLIINIPGVLGKVPMAGAAAYSASKYGLVGMCKGGDQTHRHSYYQCLYGGC